MWTCGLVGVGTRECDTHNLECAAKTRVSLFTVCTVQDNANAYRKRPTSCGENMSGKPWKRSKSNLKRSMRPPCLPPPPMRASAGACNHAKREPREVGMCSLARTPTRTRPRAQTHTHPRTHAPTHPRTHVPTRARALSYLNVEQSILGDLNDIRLSSKP